MYPLKQSTAITVPFFAHDANGDGVTGIADGSWTKRISKNGAAFAAMTVTVTEMENGWYSIPVSTSHSDTLGLLSVSLSAAAAKRVNLQFRVHAQLPDDHATAAALATVQADTDDMQTRLPAALVSGRIDASVGAMAAGVVTAAAVATGAIDADAIADDAIDAGAIAAGAITAAKIADGAIDAATFAAGAIDAAAIAADAIGASEFAQAAADKVWASASRALTDKLGFRLATEVRNGTAQAGAVGTITLDAGASATDDLYNGLWIVLTGGTGAGQARLVSDYVGTTKVASVVPNWTLTPDATSVFTLLPAGAADARLWLGAAVNALISGRVDANTQAMGTDVIGAAQLATDAIGAAEFSQAAADKVWASATRSLTTFGTLVADVATAVWGAGTRTLTAFSTGLALSVWDVLESAIVTASSIGLKLKTNLDVVLSTRASQASVDTVDDLLDTEIPALTTSVAAIKAKTDLLPEGFKKNQAFSNFMFKMVLSSDHVTAATGLTVTGQRSLDGAAFGALANAVTELSNGWYKVNLAAADLNADSIAFRFTAATADTRDISIKTSP